MKNLFSVLMNKQRNQIVNVACLSHIGNIRENNEDNYLVNGHFLPMNHNEEMVPLVESYGLDKINVFGVFDGMGGESAGELASYVATSRFSDYYFDSLRHYETFPEEHFFKSVITELSNDVYCTGREYNYRTIGTTMSMIMMLGNVGLVCNVGDSPIFRLRDGELEEIYQPHTNESWLREQGIKRTPALTQFLGLNSKDILIDPFVQRITLCEGDHFLICSDGLTNMVPQEDIVKVLNREKSISDKCKELKELALNNGGRDNITIILCAYLYT